MKKNKNWKKLFINEVGDFNAYNVLNKLLHYKNSELNFVLYVVSSYIMAEQEIGKFQQKCGDSEK